MSLDAVITHTHQSGYDLIIELEPRQERDGTLSIPGQSKQIIKEFTFYPKVGSTIWGGSDSAIINSDGIDYQYTRDGYITLIEDFT